jgi:hypothetical protein
MIHFKITQRVMRRYRGLDCPMTILKDLDRLLDPSITLWNSIVKEGVVENINLKFHTEIPLCFRPRGTWTGPFINITLTYDVDWYPWMRRVPYCETKEYLELAVALGAKRLEYFGLRIDIAMPPDEGSGRMGDDLPVYLPH